MHPVLGLLLIAALSALVNAESRADISGRATVIDGDTIEIRSQQIRLHGIDAPESAQTCLRSNGKYWRCGQEAALALDGKIGDRPVACVERDRDRYGRIVAVCRVAGEDLNAWLVSQGWALAYRRYSTDYVDEEETAHGARRGIWGGAFVAPWDWRRGERLTAKSATGEGCRIKGNISSKGERIYHVPGGRWYDRTKISATKGERWFCSEEEAKAAGWRRSKQ